MLERQILEIKRILFLRIFFSFIIFIGPFALILPYLTHQNDYFTNKVKITKNFFKERNSHLNFLQKISTQEIAELYSNFNKSKEQKFNICTLEKELQKHIIEATKEKINTLDINHVLNINKNYINNIGVYDIKIDAYIDKISINDFLSLAELTYNLLSQYKAIEKIDIRKNQLVADNKNIFSIHSYMVEITMHNYLITFIK